MSLVSDTAASWFDRAADTAKVAEMAYRKTAAAEIARLERDRVTAFRRVRLVRLLEDAARGAETADDAAKRQSARLCREFGWSGEAPGEAAVIERLQPVCRAVSGDGEGKDIAAALAAFEAWFEADRGVSFYSLFDTYIQETPVVDF